MCGSHIVGITHIRHCCDNCILHLLCPFTERRIDFGYIRDVDSGESDHDAALAIGNRNDKRVGVLRFIVEGIFCLDLPCCADNTKRFPILSTVHTIGEGVAIRIRCGERLADVCAGGRVLSDEARPAATLERRYLVDIRDVYCDKDCICEPAAISSTDGQTVVSVLRFIVEGVFGLELPCLGVNTKRVLIAPKQRIGQCIPIIWVCGCEGCADVCAGSRVLGNSARRAITFGEHRCTVLIRGWRIFCLPISCAICAKKY